MASQWLGGETPRTQAQTRTELRGIGIGVGKKDREDLKKNDKKTYYKVRDTAISGMDSKFSILDAIDEKATVEHLSSVYSIVTRFDDLKTQIMTADMDDIFTIPSSFSYDQTTGTYLPDSSAAEINLFTEAGSVSLQMVKHANAYFLQFGTSYHGENVTWSGEKILNSCNETLRDKLVESTRNWEEQFVGGPTYLKLLFTLVMSTSEKSLRVLTNNISTLSIQDLDGEIVTKAVSFIRGAVLILRDNKALPSDIITQVLAVFKKSACETFRIHVTNIDSFIELKIKTYHLDDLLTDIDAKYIELLGRNEWEAKSVVSGQQSGFNVDYHQNGKKVMCFNCGGLHHVVSECPHPQNDSAIDLRKEIMSSFGLRKSREKDKPSFNKTKDPYKQPPRPGDAKARIIDGKERTWCGKQGCKRWTDHDTNSHDDYMRNKGSHAANTISPTSDTNTTSSAPDDSTLASSDMTPTSASAAFGSATETGFLSSAYHFG